MAGVSTPMDLHVSFPPSQNILQTINHSQDFIRGSQGDFTAWNLLPSSSQGNVPSGVNCQTVLDTVAEVCPYVSLLLFLDPMVRMLLRAVKVASRRGHLYPLSTRTQQAVVQMQYLVVSEVVLEGQSDAKHRIK